MYAIDPALLEAIARVESGGRADAVSSAGAVGMMQLTPETASQFGVVNRSDPNDSALGAARFLNFLRHRNPTGGSARLADLIAAYNAGPGEVARSRGFPVMRRRAITFGASCAPNLESAPIPLRLSSGPMAMRASGESVDNSLLDWLQTIRRKRAAALRSNGMKVTMP